MSSLTVSRSLGRAAKEMLLYGFALLLIKGGSLLTLPFTAHYLSITQIGQLELLATTTVLFALIASLAMHENLYRFVATIEQDDERQYAANALYISAILMAFLVILSLSLLLLFYQWAFNVSVFEHYFTPLQRLLIVASILLESALAISLAWLRLQGRAELFFKLSLVSVVTQVSLIIWIVHYYPTVTAVFSAGVFTALLQCILLHIQHRFQIRWLSFRQLKHYLRYCLPIVGSSLVAFGLNGGERWIVAESAGLDMLGQYAIALKFALAVGILLQPFHMWWMPKRFECWKDKGPQQTAKNSQGGMVYACIISLSVAWLAKWFVTLYLPAEYHLAASLVALCCTAMLFKEFVEIVNIGLLKQKKTQALLLINLVVTSLTLMVLLTAILVFNWHSIWFIISTICVAQIVRFFWVWGLSQKIAVLPYQTASLCFLIGLNSLFLISTFADIAPSLMVLFAVIQPVFLLFIAERLQLLTLPIHELRGAIDQWRAGK
ncbi:lipopolysaccharide biosynthesis protein [Vibrio renipiscarius]|nr:oligosaccharide flippase family protein [Vibrio renipiscarius]